MRNALWVASAVLVVVLVFVGIYVGSIVTAFNDKRQTVDAGITSVDAGEDGALNVLLLGSDSRGEGLDTAENKGEDGERSDTMMLVHIPQDRQGVYVMSLVRDLWVEIPGHGERKINAALGLGGYPLVTQTVENLLDVPIDHLAVIDFEGFNGLTSALGGVQLCNPTTFSSGQVNPSFFPRGEILLEGSDALRFVRERKAFAGGDFQRVANQQRFVSAVLDRLLTVETLTNPQRVLDVVNALAPFITVDEGLDAATIASYAWEMRGVGSGNLEMFTVPHGPPAEGPGGASIVEQDEEGMAQLRRALQEGEVEQFLAWQDGGAPAEEPDDGASPSPTEGQAATPGETPAPTEGADDSSPGTATPTPEEEAAPEGSGAPSPTPALPSSVCGVA